MTLQETLLTNPAFELRDNVFLQRNLEANHSFEQNYLNLRRKEGRLYSDDQVKHLPNWKGKADLEYEWKTRKHSAHRLVHYLKKKNQTKLLLEVGCGNGWLSNLLSDSIPAQVVGLDLNRTELIQGSNVFQQNKNVAFIYGDIFSLEFRDGLFDAIILASVTQYFQDVPKLIFRLSQLVKSEGEIHILDSPFYETLKEQEQAKIRTHHHFEKIGQNSSDLTYHHHLWSSLKSFHFKLLHDPRTLSSRLSRKLTSNGSPFPHIAIHKSS